MELAIATVNDLLLPPFLFIVFFCGSSIFLYQSKPSQREETDPSSLLLTSESAIEPTVSILPIETPAELSLEELLSEVDLDHLKLRPARKIASRLGITQKVNSKDQPLSWLRAQIKKHLAEAEKPQEIAQVIRELAS